MSDATANAIAALNVTLREVIPAHTSALRAHAVEMKRLRQTAEKMLPPEEDNDDD